MLHLLTIGTLFVSTICFSNTNLPQPQMKEIDGIRLKSRPVSYPALSWTEDQRPVYTAFFQDPARLTPPILTAITSGGIPIASMTWPNTLEAGNTLSVKYLSLNDRQELIALVFTRSADNSTQATLVNLSLGRIIPAELPVLSHLSYMDRISSSKGRFLALEKENEVVVLNEDTGKLIATVPSNETGFAHFHEDQDHHVKLLLAGYDMLRVLDVATQEVFDLLPADSERGVFTYPFDLKQGAALQYVDSRGVKLFLEKDLIGLKKTPHLEFSVGTKLFKAKDRSYAITMTHDGFRILNLDSNQAYFSRQVALMQPDLQIVDILEASGTLPDEAFRSVEKEANMTALIGRPDPTPQQVIVAISQKLSASSDLSHLKTGLTLTYVDFKTDRVMRSYTDPEATERTIDLRQLPSGQVISIESTGATTRVVHLENGTLYPQRPGKDALKGVVQAKNGRIFGVRLTDQNQVCVFHLLDFENESCHSDPLIQNNSSVLIQGSRITLGLREQQMLPRFPVRGFLRFEIQ